MKINKHSKNLAVKLSVNEDDIKARLVELNINPTRELINQIEISIASCANAWACAYLQDLTKDELDSYKFQ